jgi:hypothetical protein
MIELSCSMNCKTFVEQSHACGWFLQSPWHIKEKASHVPNKSLCKAPVALMPADLSPVSSYPIQCVVAAGDSSTFDSNESFRHFISDSILFSFFTLTWCCYYNIFSWTFSTIAFDYSTFRWFAYSVCTAYTVGLLPSFIQHSKNYPKNFDSWHTPGRTWNLL